MGNIAAVRTEHGHSTNADARIAQILKEARLDGRGPRPTPGALRCAVMTASAFELTFVDPWDRVVATLMPCNNGGIPETSVDGTLEMGGRSYVVRGINLANIRALLGSPAPGGSDSTGACYISCGGQVNACKDNVAKRDCQSSAFEGVPRCPHTIEFDPSTPCSVLAGQ